MVFMQTGVEVQLQGKLTVILCECFFFSFRRALNAQVARGGESKNTGRILIDFWFRNHDNPNRQGFIGNSCKSYHVNVRNLPDFVSVSAPICHVKLSLLLLLLSNYSPLSTSAKTVLSLWPEGFYCETSTGNGEFDYSSFTAANRMRMNNWNKFLLWRKLGATQWWK